MDNSVSPISAQCDSATVRAVSMDLIGVRGKSGTSATRGRRSYSLLGKKEVPMEVKTRLGPTLHIYSPDERGACM